MRLPNAFLAKHTHIYIYMYMYVYIQRLTGGFAGATFAPKADDDDDDDGEDDSEDDEEGAYIAACCTPVPRAACAPTRTACLFRSDMHGRTALQMTSLMRRLRP